MTIALCGDCVHKDVCNIKKALDNKCTALTSQLGVIVPTGVTVTPTLSITCTKHATA
jgi:hypothetical protein